MIEELVKTARIPERTYEDVVPGYDSRPLQTVEEYDFKDVSEPEAHLRKTARREYKERDIFLGVDTERFHDKVNKGFEKAGEFIARQYSKVAAFFSKHYNVAIVTVGILAGVGVYGLLMSQAPDQQEKNSVVHSNFYEKKKKNLVRQWNKVTQFFKSSEDGPSLDSKVFDSINQK